jgi:four helix bundle protein
VLELETQLAIALDLRFLTDEEFKSLEEKSSEVQRLLSGLIASMRMGKTGTQ